jgi:hypothetical protein
MLNGFLFLFLQSPEARRREPRFGEVGFPLGNLMIMSDMRFSQDRQYRNAG